MLSGVRNGRWSLPVLLVLLAGCGGGGGGGAGGGDITTGPLEDLVLTEVLASAGWVEIRNDGADDAVLAGLEIEVTAGSLNSWSGIWT